MAGRKIKNYVLVVEDDPGIGELIQIVLQKHKYKVVVLDNGAEVEAVVRKDRPNLILMDLWIPGINGIKLTQKLKSQGSTRSIPIILISAQNSLIKKASLTKADGFLGKPFDIADLVKIVAKHMG